MSNLLQADSLEKRGALADDEAVEESPRGISDEASGGFEIIEHEEGLVPEPTLQKRKIEPKKKMSKLEKFQQNVV